MNDMLSKSQEIYTQFEKEDDRLCDIAKPMHCQKKPLPKPRRKKIANIQTDYSNTKDFISIEGGKDRLCYLKKGLAYAIVLP